MDLVEEECMYMNQGLDYSKSRSLALQGIYMRTIDNYVKDANRDFSPGLYLLYIFRARYMGFEDAIKIDSQYQKIVPLIDYSKEAQINLIKALIGDPDAYIDNDDDIVRYKLDFELEGCPIETIIEKADFELYYDCVMNNKILTEPVDLPDPNKYPCTYFQLERFRTLNFLVYRETSDEKFAEDLEYYHGINIEQLYEELRTKTIDKIAEEIREARKNNFIHGGNFTREEIRTLKLAKGSNKYFSYDNRFLDYENKNGVIHISLRDIEATPIENLLASLK